MKKFLIISIVALSVLALFVSCAKDCTCSKWTDGKNTDTNPIIHSQDDINSLNVKNCAGLNDYYDTMGLGYDETSGSGIRCE